MSTTGTTRYQISEKYNIKLEHNMRIKSIQDILPLIEQPSRYLGSEINSVKKDHSRIKLSIALAFPELYELATSHFGIQILYHILNQHKDIVAERIYAPGADMEKYLRSSDIALMSLESKTPMNRFDIIGFSLLYELNYTNMLNMLNLGKIPFFSSQRDLSFPIVIAGGPCTCNPEPVADFFDAIVIGDGEEVIMELADVWLKWRTGSKNDKDALLKEWSGIGGVYIPAFFEPRFDSAGIQTIIPKDSKYKTIKRAVIADLDNAPFPDAPIVPFGKPVHDRLRLEISRGCTRGCRFCQAGMIYRPVRERSPETLLALAEKALNATGYEDLSLLSLSTGDYQCIIPLMERLMVQCERQRIAVSLPSVRAGTLTSEMMSLIKKVRKTGFTIAPEAGSQRLRGIINKSVTENDIVNTIKDAFRHGWQVIKLYFMIGFPTETEADLKAIVDLIMELKKIKKPKGKSGKFNVSVATFIPKPHTPFQWASQIALAESKEKIEWLKKHLTLPRVHFKWQNPEVSILEGLWARGDRRLNRLLVAAFERGCKFDGWSDTFDYKSWEKAFSDTGVDIDSYTTAARNCSDPLPWDHIDTRVTKAFLKKEWDQAFSGQYTPDCRGGRCHDCGVCDFKKIEPKVFEHCEKEPEKEPDEEHHSVDSKPTNYNIVKIVYSKQDQAKFFGHLEVVKLFSRAIRRAGIPVKYSEGFHPKQKISFKDPLPIGIEGRNESLYIELPESYQIKKVIKSVNENLPTGLAIHDCKLLPAKPYSNATTTAEYFVQLKEHIFDENDLKRFLKCSDFIFIRRNRKGKKQRIDLKEMVVCIELLAPSGLQMSLKSESGKIVRPKEVLEHVFSLSTETIKQAKIVKLA